MQEEKPLNDSEQLEALLYQYINLYERWSEDRQVFAKKGAELSAAIQTIAAEVRQFGNITDSIPNVLRAEMTPIIKASSDAISGMASEKVKHEIDRAAKQLNGVVSDTKLTLRQTMSELIDSRWQWFIGIMVVALLSSTVTAKILLPKQLYQLNRHDIELIGIGSEFNDVFFLLSNVEQKKIIEAQRKIRQEKAKAASRD